MKPTMKNGAKRRLAQTNDKSNQGAKADPKTKAEAIYLGVDLHKATISVTRIIDHATPQPAQRFSWEQFWKFVQKQIALAKKVYVNYEAGAFGFGPYRQLQKLGAEAFVVHPEKLDPRHKRVQTDRLDSRYLAEKLQRYVLGNKEAMVSVYIPTEQEERERLVSRHRRQLASQFRSLKARGRGLLLGQGVFQTSGWWGVKAWEQLKGRLSPELVEVLEDIRASIEFHQKQLRGTEKKLEAAAPPELPEGMGRLTFVLLMREICNYQRFKNRRNVGGFTGLCGGVSSSGPSHRDLSINKAGNPYLRTLLIELAWRMIYWQPRYRGCLMWKRVCGGPSAHARRRKIAVVALAHQLAIDLWRWQTGRVTPEELGWKMVART